MACLFFCGGAAVGSDEIMTRRNTEMPEILKEEEGRRTAAFCVGDKMQEEISEYGDYPKQISDFFCHKFKYTLFWGNYYCDSCSKKKFTNTESRSRVTVKIDRHFLSPQPRPNPRICCSCHHPLMFVCRAVHCPECRHFYHENVDTLLYEDSCVDVPSRSTPSSPIVT